MRAVVEAIPRAPSLQIPTSLLSVGMQLPLRREESDRGRHSCVAKHAPQLGSATQLSQLNLQEPCRFETAESFAAAKLTSVGSD